MREFKGTFRIGDERELANLDSFVSNLNRKVIK